MSRSLLRSIVSSNVTSSDQTTFTKEYGGFSLPQIWAFLERKKRSNAKQRYTREKEVTARLYDHGINTHNILGFDNIARRLTVEYVPLPPFPDIFEDRETHIDDKLDLLYKAFETLKDIHNAGESHGDAYLKNFFRDERKKSDRRGLVYTCDFEIQRVSPDPQVTDILLLTAKAANTLAKSNGVDQAEIFDLVTQAYGPVQGYQLQIRDHLFYRARFLRTDPFFAHFGDTRMISIPR